MLRKRLLFLLVTIGLLGSISAQEVNARLDFTRRQPTPIFIEYSFADRGLVTLAPTTRASDRMLSLNKYDADFKLDWSKKLVEQNSRRQVDFVAVSGPNILVFLSEYVPDSRILRSYFYKFDLRGEIVEADQTLTVSPNEPEHKTDLQYIRSADKRTLLCYKILRTERGQETIQYFVFDEEGSYTRSGEFSLEYPDNQFRVRRIEVSKQGNIYVLGRFDLANRLRNAEDYSYILHRFDTETETSWETVVDLEDRHVSGLTLRIDPQEQAYLAGFYSNRNTDQIAGTVLQRIDAEGEISASYISELPENLLALYLRPRQIARGRELPNFDLRQMVLRSDGGVLLIAEQYYVITHTDNRIGAGGPRIYYTYHYDDVMMISLDPGGDTEWVSVVPKNQVYGSPIGQGFFNLMAPSGAHVFYHPGTRRATLGYQLADINGELTSFLPLNGVADASNFYPRYSEQVSNREALLAFGRGATFSLVRVRVE